MFLMLTTVTFITAKFYFDNVVNTCIGDFRFLVSLNFRSLKVNFLSLFEKKFL